MGGHTKRKSRYEATMRAQHVLKHGDQCCLDVGESCVRAITPFETHNTERHWSGIVGCYGAHFKCVKCDRVITRYRWYCNKVQQGDK